MSLAPEVLRGAPRPRIYPPKTILDLNKIALDSYKMALALKKMASDH